MSKYRIAKVIARYHNTTKPEAEQLVRQGAVNLNGTVTTDITTNIHKSDVMTINGKQISFEAPKARLWAYNKPPGLMVTHYDPQDRPTIFQELNYLIDQKVISVGRLDYNSQGLILITNNSKLANLLESPHANIEKTYKVKIFGNMYQEDLVELYNGITIEGMRYKPIKAYISHETHNSMWVTMTLTEGKNNEIRKIINYFGATVSKLIRVSFGGITLNIPINEIEEINIANLQNTELSSIIKNFIQYEDNYWEA